MVTLTHQPNGSQYHRYFLSTCDSYKFFPAEPNSWLSAHPPKLPFLKIFFARSFYMLSNSSSILKERAQNAIWLIVIGCFLWFRHSSQRLACIILLNSYTHPMMKVLLLLLSIYTCRNHFSVPDHMGIKVDLRYKLRVYDSRVYDHNNYTIPPPWGSNN